MTFSIILKDLREKKGISQRDVAKVLDISKGSIGMWESTDRMPNAKQLVILAKYFNVTTDYLLGIKENNEFILPDTYTTDEKNLIEKYRGLNPQCKKLINNTIDTLYSTSAQSEQKKKG